MPKNFRTKISRKVAIHKLEAVLRRAEEWNQRYAKWSKLETIVLVGSLARDEPKVGDVDLCVETVRVKFPSEEEREAYIEWREEVLGYAPPRELHKVFRAVRGDDACRYMKNRDGRVELLEWDQLPIISLSMNPLIYLMKEGRLCDVELSSIPSAAAPIAVARAKEYIARKIPYPASPGDGEYWVFYCETLLSYPERIRKLVLDRDGTGADFQEFESRGK